MVRGEDAARAGRRGEAVHLTASVLACQALITEANLRFAALGRAADGHPEALVIRG